MRQNFSEASWGGGVFWEGEKMLDDVRYSVKLREKGQIERLACWSNAGEQETRRF